jgi:hypothetical protein
MYNCAVGCEGELSVIPAMGTKNRFHIANEIGKNILAEVIFEPISKGRIKVNELEVSGRVPQT